MGVCCKSLDSQVLLEGFKKLEITGLETGTAVMGVHNLSDLAP
jgi:hypothetical protein